MHLANYLGYLHKAELNLAEGFRKVAAGHAEEADVYHTCNTLAKQCETHAERPGPLVDHDRAGRPAGSPGRVLTGSLERDASPSVYLR